MKTMYPAQVNSPGTELAAVIDATQDTIQVADGSVLPDAPNLLTIGTDEAAETILYTGKSGDELSGVTRGFQGAAQSWAMGTKVARYFTAYDHDTTIGNISELSTGLTALGDETKYRFDTEQRQDVVLNAGMQILNAERNAAFSLSGIKGRTLVNMLGRDGAFESANPWVAYSVKGPPTVANNEITVIGSGVATNPQISRNLKAAPVPKVGDKMFIRAIAKTKSPCESLRAYLYISAPISTRHGEIILSSPTVDKPYVLYKSFTVTQQLVDNWGTTGFILAAQHTSAAAAADTIAVYSQAALYVVATQDLGLTDDELAAKYTYVNSVQPVRNPYVIRYGENLLPPFYEWTTRGVPHTITAPYEIVRNAIDGNNTGPCVEVEIPVIAGEIYSLTYSANDVTGAYINWSWNDSSGNVISWTPGNTTSVTVLAPAEAVTAKVRVTGTASGTYSFKKPMLTLGSTPKPFKPREDSMIALQTDLYADPVTGANEDEVFEKDGQYFKLAKWSRLVLDDTYDYRLLNSYSGYKRVIISSTFQNPGSGLYAAKYDGKLLQTYDTALAADRANISPSTILISIANTDSGWGDNYTPTADEIKAYFMGWKMYDAAGNASSVYNGSGGKAWVNLAKFVRGDHSEYTTTLPTVPAAEYTPYQLVYQLATPTVEPIVSEGMLTFHEGDNQIEIGTGIVLRESVKPVYTGDTYKSYNINNFNPSAKLEHKTLRMLAVYKRNRKDNWRFERFNPTSDTYGMELASIDASRFDQSAVYSVTYLMLDRSPIVPFTGSYAANEKAMLQELTDAVQHNANAVSLLMNKKANKDSPGWIAFTTLNGWVSYDPANYLPASFRKRSDGTVELEGCIKSGVLTNGTSIGVLPVGFRPQKKTMHIVPSGDANNLLPTAIILSPDGNITIFRAGGNNYLSLAGISFETKQ